MDIEAAIGFVEQALGEKRLSRLQLEVLEQVWEERSYQEIAHSIGYEVGYIKQTGSQLWQSLSQVFGEKITKNNVQYILARKAKEALAPPHSPGNKAEPIRLNSRVDWGEATDVASFQGRQGELDCLENWIEEDGCRLVGIFGMGGIGKTCLSVKLAQRLQSRFATIIWRSLRNAPPLENLLTDILQFLAPAQATHTFSSLNEHLLYLLNCLRERRCLLILDNVETVLQPGGYAGAYQQGYDGYGQLLKLIGEVPHRSTLLITSREKPKGFAAEAGINLPVRSLSLMGLSETSIQEVLKAKGNFYGSPSEWKALCRCYAGNPLALKIVAAAIQDFFGGYLRPFLDTLKQGSAIFGDIRELLASQIHRLSPLEQQVMYWLAIEREPITLAELQGQLLLPASLGTAFEALSALERRSLIEKMPTQERDGCSRFTLQPVVMEFMTEQLITVTSRIFEPVLQDMDAAQNPEAPSVSFMDLGLLKTHALMKAQAKDYIREMQRQYIVKPLLDCLLCQYGQSDLIHSFQRILDVIRYQPPSITGYVAGNLLNLMAQLANCWEDWNFSHLTVWQAYLTSVHLYRCNFRSADLSQSVFKQACGQILTVAFSPDGRYLATGDVNHELHIWSVAEGRLSFSTRVDEGWIWAVAFSPDGAYIAGCANRGVYLWEVETGRCWRRLTGYRDRVFSVAFSPDGQWLATGSEDRLVRIWEVETGQLRHALPGHADEVRAVAFANSFGESLRAPLLASGSVDGTLRLWQPETGQPIGTLSVQNQPIWSIAFSPKGHRLACGDANASIHVWDVRSRTHLQTIKGHLAPVRAVAFSPDGTTLASGSDDRTLRLWQVETGTCQQVLRGHASWISAVAFSPDGSLLASASEDQSVRLWDSQSDRCLKTLQGHSNGVWCVASHPVHPWLASGNQDGTLSLWNHQSGEFLRAFKGHSSWVWAVAFSPDGRWLASGSEDSSIKLWDVATGHLIRTLPGHTGPIFAVLFSPDSRTLYSCSLDGAIRYWDLQNGQCRQVCAGHQGGVWALAQSRKGDLLVSGSQDGTLKIWQTQTGQCLKTLTDPSPWIRCCDISADQQTVVSGGADGNLTVWTLPDARPDTTFLAHQGPTLSVLFAPEGQTFASCGADNVIKVWDSQTFACISVLSGHTRWVRSVTYSADGNCLISCSQDETIRLWNVHSGACIGILHQRRPYEGCIIENVSGLSTVQRENLKQLGALALPLQDKGET